MSLDIEFRNPVSSHTLWERNTTHNHNKIADALSVYGLLWHPEKNGIETASQLIDPVSRAIFVIDNASDEFRAKLKSLEPENGWGSVGAFRSFLADVLKAAENHPDAKVWVSR